MDNRAIGIFDSGLGGLTGLASLRERLPGEDLLFFGDSARAPYGSRSREELVRMSLQDLGFVTGFDVKAVLIACGTSSSTAIEQLREASPVPVFGVIDSAAAAVARLAPRGKLGVIATEATIRTGAFQRALAEAAPEAEVLARACPAFVPLVESGLFGRHDPETEAAVRRDMEPFMEAGTEVLLLGCTHYPLLSGEIRACLPQTTLVSCGACAAEELADHLEKTDALSCRDRVGKTVFYTSGDVDDFAANAGKFLGRELTGQVRHVEPFDI